MSDTDGAAAPAASGELSIAQAVNILGQPPKTKPDEPATPPPERPDAAPEETPPDDGDDAEPDEAPGEDEAVDEAEEPPVQPPKSWPKAAREAFAQLPREAQQELVETQNKRDADYQRGLRDAAEKSQAAQAKEQAAEQARVQYEAALPQLFQQFSAQFQTEFQDIKTWDDVSNMRQNDPMRFMAWQEARDKGQTLQKEAYQAQERQQQEQSQRYQAYQTAESVKTEQYIAKEHTKLGTPKEVGEKVRAVMVDGYGFTDEEMSSFWWQARPMYLADSRTQQMAIDAFAWRDLQAKKAEAVNSRKPVPPVQRPGTATNRGEAGNVQLKIASDRLSKTGRLEDAVAYQNLKSQIASRRR